jgi:trimeric autotransporter adhesin
MASIINAALSGGLISTGDTSGQLQLQTAGTTALTISSAQVVNFANAPTVAGSPIGASQATATALGTVYAKQTTSGASPYLTAFGYNAGVSTTGVNNTAVGFQASYRNTSGTANTSLGYNAGYQVTTGTNNVSIGDSVLGSNGGGVTGSYNTGVGSVALTSLSSGANNVGIGYNALYNNDTASNNTAVGWGALYSNTAASNTAVGLGASYYNTSGTENCSFGVQALYSNTTSSYNTAIGKQALYGSTVSSSYNTAVGHQAGYTANVRGYNVWLGWQCGYSSNNAEYNVAIGAQSGYNITTGAGNICIQDYTARGYQIFSVTSESDRIVMGHNFITNAYIKVAWTVTSDARDKTDIAPTTYGLNFVNKLKPITFRWDERVNYEDKNPDGSKKKLKMQLGFLAQDVIALEKEFGAVAKDLLVADDEQEENLKITETKMIPVLVKALQELSTQLTELKAEVATLRGA